MSKPPFWLDSNVYIQAKNGLLDFDLAPGLWGWLEARSDEGMIKSPMMVYEELVDYGDSLSEWVKAMKPQGLFVEASEEVQTVVRPMVDFVKGSYSAANYRNFLAGADPWVVAHAKETGGTVVSHEKRLDKKCKTPRVPNVCDAFGVECFSLRDLAKLLGNLKLIQSP
jgi:hypothetical protein